MRTNHAHKFKRHTYKTGSQVYYCTLPDCQFRIAPELSLGKHAICWRCGKEFTLTTYSITLAKPHCEDCHQFKDSSGKKKKTQDKPIEKVSAVIGSEVVESLKDRMSQVTYKTLEEKDDDL